MIWSRLELFDFGHEKGPIHVEVDTRESIELPVERRTQRHIAGDRLEQSLEYCSDQNKLVLLQGGASCIRHRGVVTIDILNVVRSVARVKRHLSRINYNLPNCGCEQTTRKGLR